jgi:NADPH:quinone reductase-like Zn-dependent oxidoreductase
MPGIGAKEKNTMKAVVYTEYGPPEVLKLHEVEKPSPKDDEVLIKVYASTVTSGDCNIRGFVFVPPSLKPIARLMFGLRQPRKHILGIEFAGEIETVGSAVTRFKKGDPVFGIDGKRMGAYAEYKCIPESAGLTTKPASLTWEEAASIPNGALTAFTFLKKMADIQPGQKILVNGASGSVGSAAVQIAKSFGAEVTGVCSSANADMVKSLGADRVIDYTQQDFTQLGETWDIIFDTVGKISFAQCKTSLRPNGLFLAGLGGLKVFGEMLWTSLRGGKKLLSVVSSEAQEDLVAIKALVEAGKIKPVIDKTWPLEQIVEAHRYVDTGRKKGNVIIRVQ